MSLQQFDQRLSSLKADLKMYGEDIVNHVLSLYDLTQPGARFELKNDPFSMLSVLQTDITEILKETQDKAEYRTQHSGDIDECKRLSKLLAQISQVVDKIVECEGLISKMSLIAACKSVDQIATALDGLPSTSTELGMGKVCKVLRKEHNLLRCRLSAKVNRIFKEAVQFDFGHITVHRELKGILRSEDAMIPDAISLTDVWAALNLLHQEDAAVETVLHSVWAYLLKPLWREKKAQAPRTSRLEEPCVSEFVLDSIVREGKTLESASRSAASSKGSSRSGYAELGQCRLPLPALLESLGQVFAFLWTDVLCCNDQAAEALAAKMQTAPATLIQALIGAISQQLPKTEADLPQFRKSLEGPCRLLEAKLHSFGFLPAPADAEDEGKPVGGPLTDYIADLPSIFADLRRREILKTAREVVLSDYHNTMMAAGDALDDELSSAGDIGDPKAALELSVSFAMQRLRFDPCQTSLASCRLLKHVHDVMRQASAGANTAASSAAPSSSSSSSSQIAFALFQAARDCLELFMAIVPMQFAEVIDTVPRMGAVFYNDCLYIAHNCTLITHRYRHEMGKIDPALEQTVGFADFIPRFRSLGDRCLARHVEEQRQALSELVQRIRISPDGEGDSGSRPANNDNRSSGGVGIRGGLLREGLALAGKLSSKIKAGLSEDAEGGFPRPGARSNDDDSAVLVRRHMERLSGQWLGVLQEQVYAKLMGHLLDGVLKEAMQPILSAECISEAAGAEVSRVYRSLQHVRLVFPGNDSADDGLQRVCGSWRKFLAITDLLECSLSDVADWLPRKKFAAFTGAEMTALIRALFEDSPRRQTVLASILQMSS